MIDDNCFSSEWQGRKREELGGCDPVLLEKTIHSFALLDALAARGLEFVFKGGTSLLLRLPRIRRLSIDADIFCHEPPEKLDSLLAEVSRLRPFTGMSEDERGEHRVPSRRHFLAIMHPSANSKLFPRRCGIGRKPRASAKHGLRSPDEGFAKERQIPGAREGADRPASRGGAGSSASCVGNIVGPPCGLNSAWK